MTVSSLGDWLGVFALTQYVQQLSGRPEFAIGGVLFFRVLPGLFFGPFAGVLTDRFDRRRLMMTADLMRAGLIVSIPWIHNLYALFAVSAVMEILTLLWTPGKDATVPNLVERHQLLTANQLSLITTYGTFPVSGALVTLLAGFAAILARIDAFSVLRGQPTSLAFFLDALTFLFSASMVAGMPVELMRARRAQTPFGFKQGLRDMAEGMRFLKSRRVVRSLVFGAWVAFIGGGAVISLGPIYAARAAGGSPAASQAAWGALITAVGVGLVGGMIGAGALARKFPREKIFPVGLITGGLAVIAIASINSIPIALGVTVIAGFGAGVAWVTIFTLLQERIDDRLRGRIFATLYTGVQMSLFMSLAGWPLLAAVVGNHTAHLGSYTIDLPGFRFSLWFGGITLAVAGFLTGRGAGALRPRRRAPRVRGLRLEPRPISGGARTGLFVAFEGVEGSGKTTQLKMLHDFLVDLGHRVVVTREPGGTAIAERVRAILLDPGAKEMDPKAEALLYAASRAQHVAQVIRPALDQGAVVLCDRYLDSSLAYQGVARGLGIEDVNRLNVWATDEMIPDLVVLLKLDAATGLARTRGNPDRIEQEGLEFHRAVGDAYLELAKTYPSRFVVVDASNDHEKVHVEIRAAVEPLLRVLSP
ncbi:MAG: dTMP kinase [Actinomycetota bacterium]